MIQPHQQVLLLKGIDRLKLPMSPGHVQYSMCDTAAACAMMCLKLAGKQHSVSRPLCSKSAWVGLESSSSDGLTASRLMKLARRPDSYSTSFIFVVDFLSCASDL